MQLSTIIRHQYLPDVYVWETGTGVKSVVECMAMAALNRQELSAGRMDPPASRATKLVKFGGSRNVYCVFYMCCAFELVRSSFFAQLDRVNQWSGLRKMTYMGKTGAVAEPQSKASFEGAGGPRPSLQGKRKKKEKKRKKNGRKKERSYE